MRCNKTVVLLLALLMVFSLNNSAATKKIKRVGVCPLLKVEKGKEIADAEQLRSLLETYVEHVQIGFANVGTDFLFTPFMEQVKTAVIEEKELPQGQVFKWMFFCRGKALQDVSWDGKKMLQVFALTVKHQCKEYELILPKACGNIALVDVKNSLATCDMKVTPLKANIGDTITVDMSGSICATKYEISVYHPEGTLIKKEELSAGNAQWQTKFDEPGDYFIKGEAFNADGIASANQCEAKVYINYPPKCDLKVNPTEGYAGSTLFKLDASGSTDQDGKVVKADFTITEGGREVEKKEVTSDPLVWEKKFKKTGFYKIFLKVTDDFNAVSGNNCELEVKVQKCFYLLAEAGPMVAKGTYSGFIFARFGFSYLLVPEKFSLVGSAGGALTLAGDPFKSHFLANLVLNAHFDAFFIGGGLGVSSKVRDDWKGGLDIVGNIGLDVFKGFNKKGSVFGEIRVPVREGLKFNDAHEFLLGFRYQF